MHWQIFIIPLIVLSVWIFGTLFKSEDDKTKKGVGRRPPLPPQNGGGRGTGRTPGRRIVTDLDRFLEEARCRREPEERRKATPSPQSRPSVARPPARERPPQTQEQPRIAAPVITKEDALVALPAPQPVARPRTPEPVVGRSLAREAPVPPQPVPAPRLSPIQQQVRSLLSKPQTAATAFVLREIFDRPLCQRRR
jgi:hypothetical protein